jgi:hypothetical protein
MLILARRLRKRYGTRGGDKMNNKDLWVCRSCAAVHSDRTDLPEACQQEALRVEFDSLEYDSLGCWSVAGVDYLPTGKRAA